MYQTHRQSIKLTILPSPHHDWVKLKLFPLPRNTTSKIPHLLLELWPWITRCVTRTQNRTQRSVRFHLGLCVYCHYHAHKVLTRKWNDRPNQILFTMQLCHHVTKMAKICCLKSWGQICSPHQSTVETGDGEEESGRKWCVTEVLDRVWPQDVVGTWSTLEPADPSVWPLGSDEVSRGLIHLLHTSCLLQVYFCQNSPTQKSDELCGFNCLEFIFHHRNKTFTSDTAFWLCIYTVFMNHRAVSHGVNVPYWIEVCSVLQMSERVLICGMIKQTLTA